MARKVEKAYKSLIEVIRNADLTIMFTFGLLVSYDIRVAGISKGGRTGSDHRTLIVDLELQKEAAENGVAG